MKVPISWLNEYVDVADLSVKALSDALTFSGIEVEGVETVGAALDDHFVVGEVLTCTAHPNSDHLHVCTVSDGARELQIVCGAPNCAAGLKVPLATVGAIVPEGGFAIKKAKLRGVESFGMLCSARELKLSNEHAGLLVLDPALKTGTPMREVLPLPETVFDLEITWNRSDCLSMIGIAREFAAVLKRPLRLPEIRFAETGEPVAGYARVVIEDPVQCPRYTARVLTGITDGPSPEWMRRRLEACGVRPISLIVDVTNFVMLECGQPLHAFDYTTLAERTIIVRRAKSGETIRTLDGIERTLDGEMLVIADAARATAVAGVMGGANTEIAVGTSQVLLESATFAAPAIKRTATRLGVRTESSHRYERTVDGDLADWGSRRAVALLAELGGATVAKGCLDIDHRPTGVKTVVLRFRRAREVIGVTLDDAGMVAILERLGFQTVARDEASATFRIPGWRCDVDLEADLIEEIARMNGLDAIPNTAPTAVVSNDNDDFFRARARCRATLTGIGFSEAMHYSFLSASELDGFDTRAAARRLVLPNPVSADYAVMRDSLLPQLVGTLGRNASRQVAACALFEMGRVFWRDADGKPCEEDRVSIGLLGPMGRMALDTRRAVSNDEAMLWLKGAIETVTRTLHAGEVTLRACDHPAMEPGYAAELLLDGETVGLLGAVSAAVRHQWRLTAPLAVAELQAGPLLANCFRQRALADVPAFPAIRRDLAFRAPASVTHADVVASIREGAPKELTSVELFDIFIPKDDRSGMRSMAYAMEFRSPSRTLTDDEVNLAVEKIMGSLKENLRVDIRDK
jgi:phenylalanyl-tRNA synthetase beta chain